MIEIGAKHTDCVRVKGQSFLSKNRKSLQQYKLCKAYSKYFE